MKKLLIVLIACSLGLFIMVGYIVYQYNSILKVGKTVEPTPADVIIVLGAGVWENGPSPALKARLDRALEVYDEGLAKNFILTGGLGTFPPTEAEAMKEYLLNFGVPEEHMFLESLATNTEENLNNSKEIMDEEGWESAIIVTDVFHIKRALTIAEDLSIDASGATAMESVLYRNRSLRTSYTLREVAALTMKYFNDINRTIN
ncbi:YdcF family protein [Evansella sp. AB-rgal1]|uniref:YdcF family protein n=1 Tax=Evansella sp. AB-rgal1 TaxID=3242696 RepID=UPI00359D9180